MSNIPKISVITPSYNQGSFIEETIESVLDQDYDNFEHIVIDGGSTDNTIKILKKHPHLIWVSEPDKGQSDAFNKGLEMATGEIIGWLNSDDVYMKQAFSKCVKTFKKFSDSSVVYGNCLYIDENNKVIRKFLSHKFNLKKFLNCGYCYIPPMSTFIKKNVFKKLKYPVDTSLNYSMDYDLFIRISLAGFKFTHIPEFLSKFRRSRLNKTTTQIRQMREESLKVSKKYGGNTYILLFNSLIAKIYLQFPGATNFIRRIRYKISLIK